MKSALEFQKHPVHVVLTDLPVALWIASLAADAAAWWTLDAFWSRAAFWAIAAGLATAVPTAATGLLDYFRTVPPFSSARRKARLHGILNGTATALFAFGLWWRTAPMEPGEGEWWVAVAVSLLAVGAVSFAGSLGGELVHVHRMGMKSIQANLRRTVYGGSVRGEAGSFVTVADEDELQPGQMKHVVVNGAWLLVVRLESGWRAVDGICTHHGGALCDGFLGDGFVQCPWHGSRFDLATGAVKAGPAERAIRTWETKVEGGRVKVRAPDGAAAVAAAAKE